MTGFVTGFDFVYSDLALKFDNVRHVGYVGVDIGCLGGYCSTQEASEDIISFGGHGHFVGAIMCPKNPWTGGDCWDRGQVNINDLLVGGSKRSAWLTYLESIAGVLQNARSSGIVVLFRPLHEMVRNSIRSCNVAVSPLYKNKTFLTVSHEILIQFHP